MRSLLEQSVLVRAAPETVFALYADVPGWTGWDPDVRAASIDGPFVTGAVGSLTPMKGPRNRIAFVSVVPGRSFGLPPLSLIGVPANACPCAAPTACSRLSSSYEGAA